MKAQPISAGAALTHPLIVLALALWIVNDHLGKAMFPGLLTGKLSDVTSLMVFPLLPVAAWEIRSGGTPTARAFPRGVAAWALAAALVMVTINCVGAAATAYEVGLGAAQWPFRAAWALLRGAAVPGLAPVALTMDPSDAWTIPAALVPIAVCYRGSTCLIASSTALWSSSPGKRFLLSARRVMNACTTGR